MENFASALGGIARTIFCGFRRISGKELTLFCRESYAPDHKKEGGGMAIDSQAKIVIVGGGIMGVALAYHLHQ